ncbi:phospho-N-acetylmuramoyl-pentapeptide-transferase [Desulfurispora thermophila]|uniref:phospho-N-acetylmuramoyl-pentapeptide- transferase n=1 Tax=Desulfurispora thermophila TaxID=265470 RepID=UPI00036422A1|nr:phospho-N-acetylmuramoyl-pentapeptide-transferase [Desulfurispora thermophila]
MWQDYLILLKPAVLSFFITALSGIFLIPWLRRLKFGQQIRHDGPERHLGKAGTPTMGGIMFVLGGAAGTLAFAWREPAAWLVLITMLGFALVGFADDFIKVVRRRSLGLRAREKLLGQFLVSLLLVVVALVFLQRGSRVILPFSGFAAPGGVSLDLGGLFYTIFALLVAVGTANAVNLTDGLDGLAASVTVLVSAFFALLAVLKGQGGVAVSMAALVGGCLGFLVYNRHPARVFMGDTGSLALGGALAAAAILLRAELFLLLAGGVYALEALSVIIQVFSYQKLGRRVFRMSPLHHHFELGGWSENRVVGVFSALTLLLCVLALLGSYRL